MLVRLDEAVSLLSVEMYASKPPATTFSRACSGGDNEGVLMGVRKRIEALCEDKRGRKACMRVKGDSRCVVRASDHESVERLRIDWDMGGDGF